MNGRCIHISIIEILAGHSPDEAVAASSAAEVHTPGRRYYGLMICQHNVPGLFGFAHKMKDALLCRQVEIEIYLRTPRMRMWWHRVPHTSTF